MGWHGRDLWNGYNRTTNSLAHREASTFTCRAEALASDSRRRPSVPTVWEPEQLEGPSALHERRFAAVVLMHDPNSDEGRDFYAGTHFGSYFQFGWHRR